MIKRLEIDDALGAQLEAAAKACGISMHDFMRHALRQAVSTAGQLVAPARFVQRVHDFGTHIESPWTVLVDIETEEDLRKYGRK